MALAVCDSQLLAVARSELGRQWKALSSSARAKYESGFKEAMDAWMPKAAEHRAREAARIAQLKERNA